MGSCRNDFPKTKQLELKTNLIIGAGQLGSRHLQGLLKAKITQSVYILDPSKESLAIAKQRAHELCHTASLFFCDNWSQLPASFDLVIVATGANVRAAVTEQLITNYRVKFLILEKVLFQDIQSYDKIESLIKQADLKVWVNHPRRMFVHYKAIGKKMKEDEQAIYTAAGGNWGLACNALHLIDLFAFLSKSAVDKIDFSWVDPLIHQSKRPGYIEFTGTIKGTFKNGSKFLVTSFDGDPSELTVAITTTTKRWLVQEGAARVIALKKENAFKEELSVAVNEFQSSLTATLATQLFESLSCELPTYAEAKNSHVPFLKEAISYYNMLTGQNSDTCPIT